MNLNDIQELIHAYFDGVIPADKRQLLRHWLLLPTDAEKKDHALKMV